MGFATIWIEMLLTLVLLDFAARRLATKIERWIFYVAIAGLVIGFMLKVMHWPYGDRIILSATFTQLILCLLSFRIRSSKKVLHWIIALWLLSTFLKDLFYYYHIHDRGAMIIINATFFLVYTTWYFYLLLMESKNKGIR